VRWTTHCKTDGRGEQALPWLALSVWATSYKGYNGMGKNSDKAEVLSRWSKHMLPERESYREKERARERERE